MVPLAKVADKTGTKNKVYPNQKIFNSGCHFFTIYFKKAITQP